MNNYNQPFVTDNQILRERERDHNIMDIYLNQ